jgi:hypothetical protein
LVHSFGNPSPLFGLGPLSDTRRKSRGDICLVQSTICDLENGHKGKTRQFYRMRDRDKLRLFLQVGLPEII